MDKQLTLWLNDTVGYEQCTSTNQYGEPQYAAKVDVACFIEQQEEMKRTGAVDTLVAPNTILLFDATTQAKAFGENDRFTLPDGLAVKPSKIIPYWDEKGGIWAVEVHLT